MGQTGETYQKNHFNQRKINQINKYIKPKERRKLPPKVCSRHQGEGRADAMSEEENAKMIAKKGVGYTCRKEAAMVGQKGRGIKRK